METHAITPPRPTGRHKITLPQFRAEATRTTSHAPTTPGRALAAFKKAAPASGLSRRVVDLVDCLMSYSHPQDWDGSPGPGPLVWPSDAELEERLLLRPTQRKALVRAALDAGLIRLRRSPTGRRWGRRDRPPSEGGRIVYAYGFDLAPLAERMAEFERLAAEWDARRAEGKRLRREIACLRAEVLALTELATAQGYTGEDWPSFTAQADALMQARGSDRDPLSLVLIAARLQALHVRVSELVEAAHIETEKATTATVMAVEHAETDPATAEYRLPDSTTNQLPIAEANTAAPSAEGPDRPKAHGEEGHHNRPSPHESDRQAVGAEARRPAAVPTSALRGFVLTPDDLMRMAPAFRAWVSSARPNWSDLAEAAIYVCSELDISKHAWGQACVILGRMEVIATLAVVATRHACGEVGSPERLLRKMVALHQNGALRLDKSLFGLAARLDGSYTGRPWPESAGTEAGRERRP
ncbi:MAG: replication initiation protein RepC [Pseudomonadota bacterium]|nr:replication initiation protein RepC [Pseudomonadota bacterium]